jgi:transcriptional regulator with XRE-family HTH domain
LPRTPLSLWDAQTGKRIRIARLASKLTQQTVADKLGCTFQAVQKLEKGTTKLTAHTALVLADLFNIDVRQLLGITP